MRVKNWEKHQHFKDRCPPWIKLHRDILDQRDISVISDRSFRVLIGIWLLASEDDTKQGRLPSIPDIAFRLRMTEKVVSDCIAELSEFLIHDDIDVISPRYQDDDPETETETETETEADSSAEPHSDSPPVLTVPLAGKQGEFAIHLHDVREWQEAFPGVDVLAALRRIRQWSVDNPARRKTRKGIRQHISTWLAKAQDRGEFRRGGAPVVEKQWAEM